MDDIGAGAHAPMVSDDHAHNDYLQFLIELGVVGFAIGAVLFTGVLARAWRATTRASRPLAIVNFTAASVFAVVACRNNGIPATGAAR